MTSRVLETCYSGNSWLLAVITNAVLPRVIMAHTVSLLPGTLSAGFGANYLQVHVLDGWKEFLPELKKMEQSVSRIFGISLKDSKGSECNATI